MPQTSSDTSQLDCANVARGLWLVKVPKYLSEKWKQESGSSEIGRLKIIKPNTPKAKSEVLFRLNDRLISPIGAGAESIPSEHKFIVNPVPYQTLAVISEDKSTVDVPNETGRLRAEGRIVQKAECRPPQTVDYMKMKVQQIEEVSKPQKFIQQVDRAEIKFKPVSKHVDHVTAERKKKEAGRSLRLEKHQLQELIFKAFEKHQFYNIADLQRLTNQPYAYLKEVLLEVCRYNSTPPHKNMWELKPEYRHYRSDEMDSS